MKSDEKATEEMSGAENGTGPKESNETKEHHSNQDIHNTEEESYLDYNQNNVDFSGNNFSMAGQTNPFGDHNFLAYNYLSSQLFPQANQNLIQAAIQVNQNSQRPYNSANNQYKFKNEYTSNTKTEPKNNQSSSTFYNNNFNLYKTENTINKKKSNANAFHEQSVSESRESNSHDIEYGHNERDEKDEKELTSSSNLRGTEIFIGNLSIDTEEEELRKLFNEFGDILDIRIHKSQTKKCYAFVRFLTKEQAKCALSKNGTMLNFRQIKVTKSNDNTTIFIGNIRKNWSNSEVELKVRRIFPNCEKIEHFMDPNIEGRNRGFCFVVFKSRNEAIKALNYVQSKGGINIDGIPLTCDWADIVDEDDSGTKQVFVSGIKDDLDETKLTDIFRNFGNISEVILSRNHKTSKRKDIGFITFSTVEEAKNCVEAFKNKEGLLGLTDNHLNVTHAFSQQTMLAKKKLKETRKRMHTNDTRTSYGGQIGPSNSNSNPTSSINANNMSNLNNISNLNSLYQQPNNMMNMFNLMQMNKNPNMMAQLMAGAFMMMNQMNTNPQTLNMNNDLNLMGNNLLTPNLNLSMINQANLSSINGNKTKDHHNKRARFNFNHKRRGNQNNSSNNQF